MKNDESIAYLKKIIVKNFYLIIILIFFSTFSQRNYKII